jgi:uncharacterized protein (TIGR02266 family)
MWIEQTHGNALYFQRTGNLSVGGLSLENTIPHPVGTAITLQFSLPGDAAPVRVRGEIVNAKHDGKPGMGVKFIDLDAATAARIQKFVDAAK